MSGERGWSREWRVLIWSWAIDWGDDEWLVETTQHRFLGEEEIHHYSRAYWQFGIVTSAIFVVVLSVLYAAVLVRAYGDPDVESFVLAFPGLLLAPLVAIVAVATYFTYVPPKELRSSRKH